MPVDVEPNPHGQVIVFRDDQRAWPVEAGMQYPADIQAARHYKHWTTCAGWAHISGVPGSLKSADLSGWTTQRQRIRQGRLALKKSKR